VADALQHTLVRDRQRAGCSVRQRLHPGAQTLSLFVSPSSTKFLIDGRPIADYGPTTAPDIITSIGGIPPC
jgi:hypothetical protein